MAMRASDLRLTVLVDKELVYSIILSAILTKLKLISVTRQDTSASVSTLMGGSIRMSISVDSPSDETLNCGLQTLLLQ